jgi:succinate-semialdehyde dehydrogenase/glutarate-semialdehyde dehydrogenase
MGFQSINPHNGQLAAEFEAWNAQQLKQALQAVAMANDGWRNTALASRCELMRRVAHKLRADKQRLAGLISLEMGKLFSEAQAEIEKCATGCEYYADQGPEYLRDEVVITDAGKSYVSYQPIGTVLAVMPWNFPFWQVFRFAAPALVAGNTAVLKHASNVPQCALAIEQVFKSAGFPDNVFRTLMIGASQVKTAIEDPNIVAVTLTGSESAGRQVASLASSCIKKSVLELGGSDAFVVLDDADIELTVQNAVISRFINCGQSCIAAKRFIVMKSVYQTFVSQFKVAVEKLEPGDPLDPATTLAPMARVDLREELHRQVQDSITRGAIPVTGCEPVEGPGAFYQPSILTNVVPGMRAYHEELFGPVAIVMSAEEESDALRLANDTRYGLGGSVWTQNTARGEAFALKMQSGSVFVNGFVKSDARLPFGGIKASGYGRELSHHGIREFVNAKTIWIR